MDIRGNDIKQATTDNYTLNRGLNKLIPGVVKKINQATLKFKQIVWTLYL